MSDRLQDWEARFVAYLTEANAAALAGDGDYCALFACGAVEAVTGDDPADGFRGRFAEVRDNLEATIDDLFSEIPLALAQRGDLAWHDGSVGVVIGGEALFIGEVVGVPGLVRIARRDWVKAWGVGHG